jgi:hypothetical protein
LQAFQSFTSQNQSTINPGGVWLGDSGSSPTFNFRSDIGTLGIFTGVFVQNVLDVLLANQTIVTEYSFFDFAWPSGTGDILQFIFYFGLVMASYPAFFALYPSRERIRNIRAMKYSNGVRSFALWFSYLAFDWLVTLIVSAVIAIVFSGTVSSAWFGLGYLFVVLAFYGMASVLLSYILSLFAKSPLSAFALAAGGQA